MFTSTSKIAIFGISGCGKTYLSNYIQNIYPRKIVFDTLNEHEQKEGDLVASDFDGFSDLLWNTRDNSALKIIIKNDIEKIIDKKIFDKMLKICYYRGSLLISIEEIHNFSDVGIYGITPWCQRIFTFGRHANLSIIFSTQRLGLLNKTLLSQCTHVFIGQMFEKNDLKVICNFLNIEPEIIMNLKSYEFILWRLDNPAKYQKIKIIKNKWTEL